MVIQMHNPIWIRLNLDPDCTSGSPSGSRWEVKLSTCQIQIWIVHLDHHLDPDPDFQKKNFWGEKILIWIPFVTVPWDRSLYKLGSLGPNIFLLHNGPLWQAVGIGSRHASGLAFCISCKRKVHRTIEVVYLSHFLGKLDLSSLCSVVGLSVSDLIM